MDTLWKLIEKAETINTLIDTPLDVKVTDADFCIPPKSNSVDPWYCDFVRYKERHVVECFFNKLKTDLRRSRLQSSISCCLLQIKDLVSHIVIVPIRVLL